MKPLWSSTWNMFLLLTCLLIYLISLLGSRRTFQLGWQWEPAPVLASNSCVDELKTKQPKTTLAAWNTNLRVVSNRLNQNPALSLALLLQFLILLPVLHSLFAAPLMGVRGNPSPEGGHCPWAPELQVWKAAWAAGNSSAGPSLRCNKKQCARRWIFYYLLFPQLWECLDRV